MSVFIYVCIKVLLAICQRMNGSKLINLTKNMHFTVNRITCVTYMERENGLKLKTGFDL